MRWTVLSGGAAWVAAAGLLAACAGVVGGPTEQRVAMAPISFNDIAG
jgi:membrane-bound lytic murein transglycosylase A